MSTRHRVFISYSHKDSKWLERLQIAVTPLVIKHSLLFWDDTRIDPGGHWRAEIQRALETASIAVLLVTQNFLASDFIAKSELPPLLAAAQKNGLKVLWVAVGASMYQESPIAEYQAVNDPKRPLNMLGPAARDRELVRIAEVIRRAAAIPSDGDPPDELEKSALEQSEIALGLTTGAVALYEHWYAIPWDRVLDAASELEFVVSYMDTWINQTADAIERLFRRGGTVRVYLPQRGSDAAARVVDRFPEHTPQAIDTKIEATARKLRSLAEGSKGRLEVYWTKTFCMCCIMRVDRRILIISPFDHFRRLRIETPSFAIGAGGHPRVNEWVEKEFAGFKKTSADHDIYDGRETDVSRSPRSK
jgi:TIR domain